MTKTNYLIIINTLFFSLLLSCNKNAEDSKYHRHVGDLLADTLTDDATFLACDEASARQYYNMGDAIMYKGEKPAIEQSFKENYSAPESNVQEGYVSVPFMINCEGKSGRFRLSQMDNEYQPKVFSPLITDQLLDITKKLDGWEIGQVNNKEFDYYQYLTFKIKSVKLRP